MAALGVTGLALLLVILAARAEVPPPAYQLAAHGAGIPAAVLFAIALQESGMRIRGRLLPWPWTLNIAGKAQRFATHQAACLALLQALAKHDATRIDAGLGQINLGYHGQRFSSPCEALEPYRNLAVAASLLREQHDATGDWILAAGHYHRPAGGAPAARYRAQFAQHLQQVAGSPHVSTRPSSP